MTSYRPPLKPSEGKNALAEKVAELRASLGLLDPDQVARCSGAVFSDGRLELGLFGKPVILPYPTLIAENEQGAALPIATQAMVLYYLTTADGAPLTGRWVSFAELPSGLMYSAAYQGYTGDHLLRNLGDRPQELKQACVACGGLPGQVGDLSFTFEALPRVPLFLSCWFGDEDFPSSCKILFDSFANHYLPIDACTILGSMLTSRILKAAGPLISTTKAIGGQA